MARFFDFSDIYKPVGQLYHEDGFLNFLFEFLSLSYLIYRRGDCHDTFAFLWSIVPCQAASLMAHRDKWTAELGKALEHLPQEVRDFVRAPDSDSALLGALLACLERSGQTPPGVAADPLGGGVGAFAETAEELEAEAADPLSGGLRGGTTRKRAADHFIFKTILTTHKRMNSVSRTHMQER